MERRILKDRYWLQELLGEGAMGRVFRAADTRTGTVVAVKLLTESARHNPRLMRSLAREVRAVARMHHANIVQVVDYGQSDDDNPFFVMEYVPGQSLEMWRARISVRDVLGLADGILAALACAHARGVIHRDLKPENVIVIETSDGSLRPKLVDFGVAQLGGLRAHGANTSQGVAMSSAIIGTPAYMSPEQAQALERLVGPHSDLYALGVMLYELLTGQLPFRAESAMQLLMAHVYRPVEPLEPPPGVVLPDGLVAMIDALLEKDVTKRPQFAADVRRWLRKLDWSTASDTPVGAMRTDDYPAITDSVVTAATLDAAFGPLVTGQALLDAHPTDAQRVPVDLRTQHADLMRTIFDAAELTTCDEDGSSVLPLAPGLFGIRDVPFVGRHSEREALWSFVERTLAEATTHLVVLRGELGVGKSRLARWLAERVEEEGLMQGLGLGLGPGSALPTDGLPGMIERYLRMRGVPHAECTDILEAGLVAPGDFDAQEVPALLGWLRPTSTPQALAAGPPIDPIAVCARVLRQATRRRPVLLLLDDLAGPEAELALDLVDLLLATRHLSTLPVLCVVTVDEASQDSHRVELERRLSELCSEEGAASVPLARMVQSEVRRLASALLPVSDDLARAVAVRSAGNPQFAIEILSHWVESGQLVEDGDGLLKLNDASTNIRRLPGELVEMMRSRLGAVLVSLPDPQLARALLGRTALCGRRFSLAVLEALLEREKRTDLSALVDPLVERMLDERLWLEIEAGVLQFTRAEVHAQAFEHLVPRTEAMVVHAHLARIKTEHLGERLPGSQLEIAEHELHAGLYDDAAESLLAAGRQALTWGRYSAARETFARVEVLLGERSLSALTRLSDEVDLGLALCSLRTGDYDSADARLDTVEQRLRGASRQQALATAALLRAEVTFKRGHADQAAERFRAARARFESIGEHEGVARSLQGLADVSRVRGDYEAGRAAAVEAHQIHEALGNVQEAARCLLIEGMIAHLQNEPLQARARYSEARATFESAGDTQGVLDTQSALGALLLRTGRYLDALELFGELVERFAELGDRANVAHCHRALGQIHLALKRPRDGEREHRRALELAETIGDKLGVARALNGLGEAARAQRAWATALDCYQRYVEAAHALGAQLSVAIGHANLALIHIELAQWPEARSALEPSVAIARQVGNRDFLAAFLALLALACGKLGVTSEASAAMSEALVLDSEVRATQPDYLSALEGFFVACQHTLPELAERALETAVRRWHELGDAEAAERAHRLRDEPAS